jgi:hypothetical protein
LDRSDWHVPSDDEGRKLKALADRLDVYVMSYRTGCCAAPIGLCQLLRTASLGSRELKQLQDLEAVLPSVAIVAYQRPLAGRKEPSRTRNAFA